MKNMIHILYCLFTLGLFSPVITSCDAVKDDIIIDDETPVITNDYREWSEETLRTINSDLLIDGTHSYYENQNRDHISYIWGNIFLLYAYTEGVKVDAGEWTGELSHCFTNCELHWHPSYRGIAGYSTLPTSEGAMPDRFYDENGWMAIGLSDAYLATKQASYLEKAKAALAFALSGEDDVLEGGIYFKETFTDLPVQKNTICSAVAMLAAAKLYEITKDESYLEAAKRINEWTCKNLLDPTDNLFWDAIMVADKTINKQKWSYNAGFMVRSWLKLYQVTGDENYLTQAQKTLASAESKWFNAQTGALNDPGYFAFTLIDCWFDLYDIEKNNNHLAKAFKAVNFLYDSLRDENGRYPEYWNKATTEALTEWDLRYGTVVAYMYMRAATYKDEAL